MFKKKKDKVYDFLPILEKYNYMIRQAKKYQYEGDIYNQMKMEIKAEYYMKGASEMYNIFTSEVFEEPLHNTCNIEE